MKSILVSIVFLLSTHVFAGDTVSMRSVGFSPKGSYYAFVNYSINDGSGAAEAFAAIVDVKKNAYVATAKFSEDSSPNPTEEFAGDIKNAIRKVLAKLPLKAYKIVPGKNLGTNLVYRPYTDKTAYTNTEFTLSDGVEGGAGPIYRRYSLEVTETNAPITAINDHDKCVHDDIYGSKLLKLTLRGEDKGNGALVQILQDDKNLPESRACGSNYAVRRVTAYKNSYVVQLAFITPGFEGPDLEQMVVTAVLNLPEL